MVLLNLKISRLLCVSTLSQPYGISEYNVFLKHKASKSKCFKMLYYVILWSGSHFALSLFMLFVLVGTCQKVLNDKCECITVWLVCKFTKFIFRIFLRKEQPPPQKITKQNKKPKTELGPTQIRNLIFKGLV